MSTDFENDDDVTNDLVPTFLNPADFPEGTSQTFRIAKAEKRTFNDAGKWVLTFHDDQCLGLNTGNLRLVAQWFSRRPSAWIGKLVAVYRDSSVTYQGEVKGGWRLRLPAPDEKPVEPVALDTELTIDDVPWSGVREATAFGHSAPQPQLAGPYDFLRIIDWITIPGQAEDCLVLNVWTRAVKDNAKRPVLVSFHGGGFALGSGSHILYNGHPLAKFGDVVVVTLNHRLGCLGYLSMVDVGAPQEFAQAGASGMLDCVLALEWVRDNIANFGGDSGNVMIFGQSGGGAKVSHLLAMPAARGLFHKAAIQSGSRLRAITREAAARATEQLLTRIGFTKKRVTELQQVPVEMLISAQGSLKESPDVEFAPPLDGSAIVRHPFDPDAPAISADVPVIVSTTLDDESNSSTDFDLDDAGLRNEVTKMAPSKSDAILAAYRRTFPRASPHLLLGKMETDRAPRRDAYTLADRKAALQRASVYMYILEFPSPAYGGRFGAVHCTDVPLVFHNTDGLLITGTGLDSRRMADQMAGAWVAFAKSGNPNHAGIPDWPTYTPDKRQTMIFNRTSRVENDPWAELRAMWIEG